MAEPASDPSSPDAPRPRPPATEAGAATAERLRDEARALFAERGYTGASLGEICARVGIRKPSVYNHYASKEALFLDLLRRSLDDWGAASPPPSLEGGPLREQLETHLRALVGFAVERPHATALCRVAVSQVGDELEHKVRDLLRTQRLEYQRHCEELFRGAIERGEVIDVHVDALVYGWLTFVDGVLSHQLFGYGRRRQEFLDHLDAMWRLYWRGIAANPGEISAEMSTEMST